MSLIDEHARAKADALAVIAKVKGESRDLSAEEKADVEKKFNRCREIETLLKTEKQIAALELESDPDVKAVVTQSFKANKEENKVENKNNKNDLLAAIKHFGRTGKYEFGLTSGTNSGILMPKDIPGYSVTRYVRNAYRLGFAKLGQPTMSFSYSDNMKVPTWNDVSNVANNDQEGATSGATQDATTSVELDLNLVEYHSKAQWLSKKLVNVDDYDVTAQVIPSAIGRIEKQEDVDWTVLVKTATTGKTCASTTAFTFQEFVDFDESLGAAYADVPQFIVVSQACKTALRKLADDQHRPLLDFTNGIYSFNGKPIVVSPNMDAMTANKTIAAVVAVDSLNGAIIRDTTFNEVVRYENQPGFPAQVGFEALGWSAFAYNAASVRLLKTAVS